VDGVSLRKNKKQEERIQAKCNNDTMKAKEKPKNKKSETPGDADADARSENPTTASDASVCNIVQCFFVVLKTSCE